MTPDQILAFVMLVLSGDAPDGFPGLQQGGHDPRYPVTVETCPAAVPPLDVEGQTVVCGSVEVPENHDTPDGRRIDLQFAVLKARSEAPQKDALIYLHGGPGGKAVPDMGFYDPIFAKFRDNRDIVLFDQRASGISDATVTCFDTLGDNVFAFAGEEEAEGDPLTTCLDELKDGGVELTAYNTTSNARDVRAIMSALGYPVYNVYGASYGTKLGQELMRSAPEGLRAVILDSVAPVFARSYDGNSRTIDKAVGSIVDRCMAQDSCKAAYPNLEENLRGLGEMLEAQPIPATATRPEITVDALRALWDDRNKTLLPGIDKYLPKILTEWANGDATTWDLYKAGVLTPSNNSAAIAGAFAGKVDKTRLIAGYSIALQAEQLAALNNSLMMLMSLLSLNTSHPPEASGLEARLDAKLGEMVADLERDALLAFGKEYTGFVSVAPTREALVDWVSRYFTEPQLAELLPLIAAMTPADLEAFRARAEVDTGKYYAEFVDGNFDLAVYACQEDVPFNSRAGWEAVQSTYRFPWVEDNELEMFYDLCDHFDHVDRPGFHDPVTSDIPVLAAQGLADTQTDNDAATRVAKTLSHAQVVTFPQSGHAVIFQSQCATDIMAAFIAYPDQQVDTSCTEKQAVTFVGE